MDSSQISHNWLAFSLSNHPLNHLNKSNITTTTTPPGQEEEKQIGGDGGGATGLSIFSDNNNNSPKLEDFLGGSTTTTTTTTTPTTKTEPPPPPPHNNSNNNNITPSQTQFFHFSSQAVPPPSATSSIVSVSDIVSSHDEHGDMIYDSELKTIAASFLRGFSNDQNGNDIHKHQSQYQVVQLPLVPSEPAPKKSVDTFGQRTSIFRGVTRHRWTGRYEAHLWDNSCRREGQSRKGRQVYLGGYDKEEKAARAYDLAALKYWGPTTTTNFPVSDYEKELEEMKHMTRQEFVASLRRKSSGFSRGASIYRGVTRHHQHGRWQARIGRVAGNKDLYLGTFSTQEEAAEAYDIAAIKFRGLNAVTNFDMSRYDVKSIASSNLPIGGISGNKSRNVSESVSDSNKTMEGRDHSSVSTVTFASQPLPNSTLTFGVPIKQDATDYWSILGYQTPTTTSSSTSNSISRSSTIAMSALFQTTTNGCPTGYNPDHQHHVSIDSSMKESDNNNNGVMLFNNEYMQQGSGGGGNSASNDNCNVGISSSTRRSSSSIMPITMPITLNSNGTSFEGSAGYGSWIGQSLHSLQAAKPNLSMFQTPIFGME